jgi:hypothetical protein
MSDLWFYAYGQFIIWVFGLCTGWMVREVAFKLFGHDFKREKNEKQP